MVRSPATTILGAFAAAVYLQIINPSGLVDRRLTLGGRGERGMAVNTFARVEAFGLFAAGFLWVLLRKFYWRLLLVPVMGIIVLVIYNSGSRGTMVALMGGAVVLVTFLRRGKYFQRFAVAILVLLLSVTTIWMGTRLGLLSRAAAVRFESITQPGLAGRQRMPIWIVGMEMGVRNIGFGVGYNAFTLRYDEYDRYGVSGPGRAAHNSFVGAFAELGLLGLILFVIPFFILGWRGYRIEGRSTRGLVLGGAVFMILSSMTNDTYVAKDFFALFGLLIAVSLIEIRRETLPSPEWDTSEWNAYG